MIVLDIETSGTNFHKCGIWQIGALEFENPENYFLEEARIDNEDEILNNPGDKKTVYEVTGLTDKDFRDKKKQSQRQLIEKFFRWCEDIKIKNPVCQNPQFDMGFLNIKSNKYGIKIPLPHRAFDVHSLAALVYQRINRQLLIKENSSGMGLTKILEFCGMKDNRKAHNALEDTKLTAECFSRLLYGKNLLPEYTSFPVPEYLEQN